MPSMIPSWAIAIAGAVIAIAATAISSTLLYHIQGDIAAIKSEISDARIASDRLWRSHLQADQRSTTADVFLAHALGAEASHQSFLHEQAANQLFGAVLSMWAASGEPVPDGPPNAIVEAKRQLHEGDVEGYVLLKSKIDQLRLLSQEHINGQADDIQAAESRIESLQVRESRIYLAYVFFNLLGLMVTMCKDLPVWKGKQGHTLR